MAQIHPNKNTAVRSSKRGDLVLHKDLRRLPRRGVLLEPLSGKVLGPEDYEQAVNDMINLTSTKSAPWHVIPANDKYYARIEILKTVCHVLQKQLKLKNNGY